MMQFLPFMDAAAKSVLEELEPAVYSSAARENGRKGGRPDSTT